MQDQGDPPARPGRPSLLSSGPQAEPERQRILSSLEGAARPAAAPAPARRKGRAATWAGIGVAGAALAAAVVLLAPGDDREAAPVRIAASAAPRAAAVAEAPATAAPAAPTAPALAPAAPAPAVPVPAAPTPVSPAAVLRDAPDSDPAAHANPLAELAPARPAPHKDHKDHKDQLTRALEKPADKGIEKDAEKDRAHAQKARERKAEQARLAQNKAAGKEKAAKKRAASEPDSDVLLLSALMAHMQPKDRKATPAQQLETCKRYNAAGEEQCRARVCLSTGAAEPACAGVAKAAPAQ